MDEKLDEAPGAPVTAGRLTLCADALNVAGGPAFNRHELATAWNAWQPLESALKRLDPPITSAELDLLGTIPTGTGGHRGHVELCSALATTRGVFSVTTQDF